MQAVEFIRILVSRGRIHHPQFSPPHHLRTELMKDKGIWIDANIHGKENTTVFCSLIS